VEFARGTSIKKNEPRHPWHWVIVIQNGHVFAISASFRTLHQAVEDFAVYGVEKLTAIEQELAKIYSHPNKKPYDLDVYNFKKKEAGNE